MLLLEETSGIPLTKEIVIKYSPVVEMVASLHALSAPELHPNRSRWTKSTLASMDTGDRDQGNIDCAARLIKTVVAPPVGITAEQTASAKQLMDEVIVPKFQALIAGETTAQAMYDEIVKQATAVFGEDGCDLT